MLLTSLDLWPDLMSFWAHLSIISTFTLSGTFLLVFISLLLVSSARDYTRLFLDRAVSSCKLT